MCHVGQEYHVLLDATFAYILTQALFTMLDGDGKYSGALNTFLSNIRNNNPYTPGGMVFISEWGSTRQAANAAFIALMVR